MKYLIKCLWFTLTHPKYWMQLHTYSKEWDAILNLLLDTYDFIPISYFDGELIHEVVLLGNIELWRKNTPYCCMYPWCGSAPHTGGFKYPFKTKDYQQYTKSRASHYTIHRALKKLEEDKKKWTPEMAKPFLEYGEK